MATVEVDPTSAIGEGFTDGTPSLILGVEGTVIGDGIASLTLNVEDAEAIGEGYASSVSTFVYGWREHAPMPAARQAGAWVEIDNFLYYIGGMLNDTEVVDRTWYKYDPELDVWTEGLVGFDDYLPERSGQQSWAYTRRMNAITGVIDGIFYSLGGFDRLRYDPQHKVAFSWNPETNIVNRLLDPVDFTSAYQASATRDDKIWYVSYKLNEALQKHVTYMNYWDPVADVHVEMNYGIFSSSSSSACWGPDDKFHLFAGSTTNISNPDGTTTTGGGSRFHRIYDPVADSWSVGPEIPTNDSNWQTNWQATVSGGFIYLIQILPPYQTDADTYLKYDPFLETYTQAPRNAAVDDNVGMQSLEHGSTIWMVGGRMDLPVTGNLYSLRSLEKDAGVVQAIGEGFASNYVEGWSFDPATGEGVLEGEPEVVAGSVWLSIHGGPVPLTGEGLLDYYRSIRTDI